MSGVEAPGKDAARRAFERAARTFDGHAALHREVGRRLADHLDAMRIDPARIVDLGCGTGGSFDALRGRYPYAQVVGIDFAGAMLERARARSSWWQRVRGTAPRLACADAEALPLAGACAQLVFSNLALHWCRPEPFFAEGARVLEVGGLLLFATLGPDTLMELRESLGGARGAPHVHPFLDMHDLGDALVHAGFADPVMEMERVTLEYPSLDALARELKAVGARNTLPGRAREFMGRGAWPEARRRYEKHRRGDVLPATCEVVYGHAWKAAPRRLADGRQVIGFRPRP